MTARRFVVAARWLVLLLTPSLPAEDWITAPSYYTHGANGQRVQQHTPIGPFYTYLRDTAQRSGYHHTRSSVQFGGSVDHYHLVEEWGLPVRPYDEWRFPYRPYSVPYSAWGPPYGGLGGFGRGLGYGNGLGFGYGYGLGFAAFPFLPFPIPLAGVAGAGGQAGFPNPGPPFNQPIPPAIPPGNFPGPFPPGPGPAGPGPFPPGWPPNSAPGFNPAQQYAPYRGYEPWFDDRYPAFDDRAPWRYEPFPRVPNAP